MDEKTDGVPLDKLPAPDAGTSAGNDADADLLSPNNTGIGSESFISAESTETVVSTDALTDTVTNTETTTASNEISEVSVTNTLTSASAVISSDASSVADALTSVDNSQSAEELTQSANVKADDVNATPNKVSSVDVAKPSPAVCQLEEELKRLHEGDPIEESKSTEDVIDGEGSAKEKITQEEKGSAVSDSVTVCQADKVPVPEESPVKELDPVEMLTAADDVSKDPILIKNAQEDIKKIDVLVCGSCHEVFYFVEEFQAHKSNKCSGKSHLTPICEGESKPQVWGFTLWKNKQQKQGENILSSWAIYQRWCKLPQIDKDAWIIAGQTIQFCSKIGTAKVTELKPKAQPQSKQIEKDPLALDGFDSNKENSVVVNTAPENKPNATEVIKKTIVKPVKLNNDVTILPSTKNGDSNSNKALRTVRSTEKREYVVERIVAKRFNPKRKTWEYQIKWENFPSEDNTWEPVSNLNHCKQMVEEFEEQLKKLKAEKAKQQAMISPKVRGRPIRSQDVPTPGSSSFTNDSTPGRPQRTSKQKALNQVKAWCGNISDTDEGGIKRAFEDDDSDDSFEKKMKYEEYSDDSDVDIKPKTATFKKIAPKPPSMQIIKSGLVKPVLPQNILIPDANGVVRINQKQLPSLSTGVYIMSKTAGIIKLDSTTSKVATSGGQTIVKVAPKIGQTQIKIVKKDGGTTTTKQIIQMTPNKNTTNTSTKMYKPVITKVKKQPEIAPKPMPTKVTVKPKEEPKKPEPSALDDDSDDGLEELPFPDNIPLPEPDSPPRDFVLDPITGKIAGQEYPESEPETEEVKFEADDSSIENIVKLAAADITEDDLKSESVDTLMETEPIPTTQVEETRIIHKTEPITMVTSAATTTAAPVKVTVTSTLVKSEPSILNKALSGSTILRKSLMNTPPQAKVQQRILNQSVASRTHSAGSVVRSISHGSSLVRTRPVAPRPKFNIAGSSSVIRSQHEVSPKNVYSKSTLQSPTRKIGNTTIRSTGSAFPNQRPTARIVQTSTNIQKVSPRKEPVLFRSQVSQKSTVPAKPKTVISMPSLIGDDEPSLSPPATEVTKPPAISATTNASIDAPTVTPAITTESSVETPLTTTDASSPITDISSFTLADSENPIFITGDDGTVYQVAGQNEQGQTILLTQGSDGQQQCLLVTNEVAEAMETSEEPQEELSVPEIATDVTEPLSVKTDVDTSDQVVAQVVRAEPPSPGGTHKVVVMLPDGNLMVTQVSPEEYASLELE